MQRASAHKVTTSPCSRWTYLARRATRHRSNAACSGLDGWTLLVANAGITRYASMLESDEALWDLLMNTNLKSAYFGAQAAAQRMIGQSWGGRIMFSSSVAGMRGFPELTIYSITKADLQQMARTIAAELAAHRITVNAVGIGAVLNARNLETDPHYESRWAAHQPTRPSALSIRHYRRGALFALRRRRHDHWPHARCGRRLLAEVSARDLRQRNRRRRMGKPCFGARVGL